VKLKRLLPGNWSICAVVNEDADGDYCDLEDFLHELPADYYRSGVGIGNLFEHVAQSGPQLLPDAVSHYVDKDEKIWEFIKGKIRVLWFYDNGQLIICSHAFIKKTQKTPKSEKLQAIKCKKEYFAAKKAKKVKIIY
jgi:hypothetical protein